MCIYLKLTFRSVIALLTIFLLQGLTPEYRMTLIILFTN